MIQEKSKSPFTLCRIATDYDNLEYALEISNIVSEMGYETALNLMRVSTLSEIQIVLALEKIVNSNISKR